MSLSYFPHLENAVNMHIWAYVEFSRCAKSDRDIFVSVLLIFCLGFCAVHYCVLCGASIIVLFCQVPEMWPNQRVVAVNKQQKLSN